ncbi:MAG: MBL fold metallo-hydrolase [Clostridiales bacterium]|nr:MBL fold metallo-hydrolase [Clostridiales bacterium]
MKKRKKSRAPLATAVCLIIVAVCTITTALNSSTFSDKSSSSQVYSDNEDLVVHYLDVGQGDSEFIELPNGECMLIDAGEKENADYVVETIQNYGYDTINYVVATHPHTDHIGAMADVIDEFSIDEVYMPKAVSTSATYENLLETISDKNLEITTAKSGVSVYSDSELDIEFLAPVGTDYSDLNNFSAVLKITYNETSFLFTGDAEDTAEEEMLENCYYELDCDVLKVGHHGSRYSSTEDFLNAVTPQYAVIEVGEGNSYGHPHDEAIERLENIGAEILRTDELGLITIRSDGENITVE